MPPGLAVLNLNGRPSPPEMRVLVVPEYRLGVVVTSAVQLAQKVLPLLAVTLSVLARAMIGPNESVAPEATVQVGTASALVANTPSAAIDNICARIRHADARRKSRFLAAPQ